MIRGDIMQRLSTDNEKPRSASVGGCCALLLWILLGCVVWCGILPAISRQPRIRAEIEHLDAQRIDPSAMFYTDLELMDDLLPRIDRFQREHPRALWDPSAKK